MRHAMTGRWFETATVLPDPAEPQTRAHGAG